MIKKLDSKQKKPKNFADFLKTYSKEKKEIKKDIKNLEKEFKDIKKHNYWIPIALSVAMVSLTAFNSWMYYAELTQESLISDVTATEEAIRMGNDELYQLTLHNYGEVENDVQITIQFTLESEIIRIQNPQTNPKELEYSLTGKNTIYFVKYEKIFSGEDILIRLDVSDDRLKNNESFLVYPKLIKVSTMEGKVIIH